MKKILLTACVAAMILSACNDNKINKDQTVIDADEMEMEMNKEMNEMHSEMAEESTDLDLSNAWVEDISLDAEDAKWKANKETNEGVEKMRTIIQTSEKNSIEDYHALADKLNEVKNDVVAKCTMEGVAHDNLHVFLHPLIRKIDRLAVVDSKEEGAEIVSSMEENLTRYYDYFQ